MRRQRPDAVVGGRSGAAEDHTAAAVTRWMHSGAAAVDGGRFGGPVRRRRRKYGIR